MIFFLLFLLFPSWVYAGVPPTINAWYSIPGTHLETLCPDVNIFLDCKYMTIAWSSATLDQNNSIYYDHGGGHNNYWGNNIEKLNLNTLAFTHAVAPTQPVAADGTSPDCIGSPCVSNAKHLYDGFVWVDLIGKAMIIGGSPSKNGGFVNSIWLMDPTGATPTAVWRRLTDSYETSGTGGSGNTQVIGIIPSASRDKVWSCAYAEVLSNGVTSPFVYCFDQLNLYAIDPVANTMRSLTNRNTVVPFYMTAQYDPVHKVVVILGGTNTTFATFDTSGGPTVQVPGSGDASMVSRPTTGATAIAGSPAPGLAWDADLGKITAWGSESNLNTIYVADMTKALANAADTWSTITTTGAPNPNIEPASGNHGVYKRWIPSKKLHTYYYIGDANDNMYALRLVAPDNFIRVKETSGTTQTNRPVSIGRPFRQGDIGSCPQAWVNGSAVTTQTDVKSRWSDGSVKFGIVSFVLASLTANATQTVYLVNNEAAGGCNNTGGLTQTQALDPSYNFDVIETVVGTSTKTASARSMLTAGAATTWLTGPVVTSFILEDKTAARIYDMDPNSDGARPLHPQFQCDFYPSLTKAFCSVILENDWISNTLGNSTRSEAITYSISAGISPVAKAVNWKGDLSEAFSTHPFTGLSRSHITLWVGTAPGTILVDHNLAYLGSTRLIPNYDSSLTINASRLTTEKTAWSSLTTQKTIQGTFNGTNNPIGNWDRLGADGGGGHPWIGLFPTWDTIYLYSMSAFDQTMQDKFYGNADLLGRLQIHMRELDPSAGNGHFFDNAYSTSHTSPLGRHLSVSARQQVSTQDFSDTCSGTIGTDQINLVADPIEWSSYSSRWAPHHSPGADYLQYLLSGRYFYLEETQMQAAYYLAWAHGCLQSTGGGGRQGDKGYFGANSSNEVRGAAWAYRSMIYAYSVSPDGTPEKAYWDWYVKQNLALLEGQSGVTNTDAQHLVAYQYGTTNNFFSDGPSAVGEWTRYLDDGGSAVGREDGTPSRNVQDCNGAGFTCATAPWMENFLLSAVGMGYGTGLNVNNLLTFRARYNFGISIGQVNTAFGDNYRMAGKVERSYSAAPGNTGQGWMLRWSDVLQYMQPRTGFTPNGGSDQRYQFIFLGANAFLGPVSGVYSTDGNTAYSAYRTSLNAAQPLTAQFDGSLSPSDPTYDSPKWDILPWTTTPAPTALPTPPAPPNPASNVRVSVGGVFAPGTWLWNQTFGTATPSSPLAPNDMAADSTGNLFVTGSFQNTIDFGGGNTITSAGSDDIFLAKYNAAGTLQWVKRFGGTLSDVGWGVAADSTGAVVITGAFQGTVDFGGGPLVSAAGNDVFLAKYSSTGAFVWAQRFGSTLADQGYSVKTDASNNVLMTGFFNGTVNFGTGNIVSNGSADIFLAKYTSAGAALWTKGIGGTGSDIGRRLALDTLGNVLLTGYFAGSTDFGGGVLTSAGANDAFLAKYTAAAGAFAWAQNYGGTGDDRGASVATDSSNNVIATGTFADLINFGCGALPNTGGGGDIYLVKLSSTGVCQWSSGFGTALPNFGEVANAVAVDSSGNIFLTGGIIGSTNFGGGALPSNGTYDVFIAKFNGSGLHQWSSRYPGTFDDFGTGFGLNGTVNLTGYFPGTINLGGGVLTNVGGQFSPDGFVASFAP